MGIPLDVLEKWSKPGKSENSKNTYEAFRKIIFDRCGNNLDVFLQGSYSNSTHVKDNSDIDIVVVDPNIMIDKDYYGILHGHNSLYGWKQVLFNKINGAQNFNLKVENKTIKYDGNNNYVPADIVPCGKYKGMISGSPVGTILYDSRKGKFFINYPKQHYDNGTKKSDETNGNFKKTVRMFKNARNRAVSKNLISSEGIAPSYFLECLIYNVPNSNFTGNESEVFFKVIKWLYTNKQQLDKLKCQNGLQNLFGYDLSNVTYNKWNIQEAILFIDGIAKLWDNWGK